MPSTIAIVISIAAVAFLAALFISEAMHGNLNIKARTVGDGQYGTARWATKREEQETYDEILYEPKMWRAEKHLPDEPNGAAVLGILEGRGEVRARIDNSDNHTLILSTTGGRKTTGFLYPNLEFICACGCSFLATDTKGDVFRDYAGIAQKYYHYTPYIIDLRNPTRSHGFNLLHLVNKYTDLFKETGDITYKARAERYAKITAKTIVRMEGFDGGGQNAYFYDAAEGLIASTILLVAEFCGYGERHIVSVFKIVQELLQTKTPLPSKDDKANNVKPKNEYQKLIELLPAEHKARWLAGAALNTAEASMHSVMSTAMSRLLSFIDSELEQILCFDSDVDAEQFCNGNTAVFIVFPEEDATKHFLVSLFVSQLYNESLVVANQDGKNRLDKRVYFYLDEFGTLPKFDNAEQMFTAGKSRNILLYPMIQSMEQLHKNYGREGGEIIIDCCTNALFGGFTPLSKGAEEVSRALGNQTVQSGSTSRSGSFERDSSTKSLQMIQKPLMTAEQIRTMPDNQWILTKTRTHPLKTILKRFDEWGIKLDAPFAMPENATRTVSYASREKLKAAVLERFPQREKVEPLDIHSLGSGKSARRKITFEEKDI
ncbi:type IV secretory system conjugative DNA transfer family protein [Caproiciproducens faecalis]|uniref:Type IV secretory system conjugative DNA transfer family protein n=1 Tax=Caproiciproducens faecalis TaxID=2820301 RepID=A0ABS7DPF8_9FIRM|nr:type IV secretory system conjugative DNA transfer family protein [Caproiciproducens faecalis]MBW7573147.1 type IV secretory system conjugative DNA transfer family protein [Caproiciproducens faecalis]